MAGCRIDDCGCSLLVGEITLTNHFKEHAACPDCGHRASAHDRSAPEPPEKIEAQMEGVLIKVLPKLLSKLLKAHRIHDLYAVSSTSSTSVKELREIFISDMKTYFGSDLCMIDMEGHDHKGQASHIMARSKEQDAEGMYDDGFRGTFNVWDPRNGLFFCEPLHKAFEKRQISGVWGFSLGCYVVFSWHKDFDIYHLKALRWKREDAQPFRRTLNGQAESALYRNVDIPEGRKEEFEAFGMFSRASYDAEIKAESDKYFPEVDVPSFQDVAVAPGAAKDVVSCKSGDPNSTDVESSVENDTSKSGTSSKTITSKSPKTRAHEERMRARNNEL